jgi:hypothetical protein
MNNKFNNIIKKFLTEDNFDNVANALKQATGSQASTPAGALQGLAKAAQAEANKINPNAPKTPVEQLQALVDPANKNVTHLNQIQLTPDIKTHLQSVGLAPIEAKPETTTPSNGEQPNEKPDLSKQNPNATGTEINQ